MFKELHYTSIIIDCSNPKAEFILERKEFFIAFPHANFRYPMSDAAPWVEKQSST